jgi:hypothetical protein
MNPLDFCILLQSTTGASFILYYFPPFREANRAREQYLTAWPAHLPAKEEQMDKRARKCSQKYVKQSVNIAERKEIIILSIIPKRGSSGKRNFPCKIAEIHWYTIFR